MLDEKILPKKPKKITISMQQFNELKNLFGNDTYIMNTLRDVKPNTNVVNLFDYIADMHEHKELTEEQLKGIENSRQLQRMLRISIDYRKKVAIDVETQANVKNLLHFNKTPWLYNKMSTNEIIMLSETPFNDISVTIDKLITKYNRKTFEV